MAYVPAISDLWAMPTVITASGKYLTRAGEVVSITKVGKPGPTLGCIGTYPNSVVDSWHHTGRLYSCTLSDNDIVRAQEA